MIRVLRLHCGHERWAPIDWSTGEPVICTECQTEQFVIAATPAGESVPLTIFGVSRDEALALDLTPEDRERVEGWFDNWTADSTPLLARDDPATEATISRLWDLLEAS